MENKERQSIILKNLEEEMKESYLRYSMSVIISRALPDARDGLKPSQRRILYAMRQLKLSPSSKHRKCAKICGDTSGDYHPHGESVIYPTLVRLAQSWAMRYPLVGGQGNFGSIDGDPPAAMRYTEARLMHGAVQMMEDLDKETVLMVPNYDETKVEPTVLPSKFPNLLCNGSSGIAVGMATNIPPHNLHELIQATLLLLENPLTTIDEIIQVMPGPDFPTGGIICGHRGIREAYTTGRGKLTLRGSHHLESYDKGARERIVLDEIPYNVNKSRLIEQIASLVNDKTISSLSDVRDESDKDGLRIVLDLKRGEIVDVVLNQLYRFTDFQVTFGCIMLALDKQMPKTMNIKQMIVAWIDHRVEVVRRRTRYELKKAEARAHILEGYLKAISHLDEIVALIRRSANREEAKKELIAQYELTEKQAHAVLDLRLYQLTGLERGKIQEEYGELQQKIAYYKSVLASEELVKGIIQEELKEVEKIHASERRTKIEPIDSDFNMEDLIPDTQMLITISRDDYVKRVPIELFKEQKRGGQGVIGVDMKKSDLVKSIYIASAHDTLLIFTSFGKCYWLKVWQLPETERRAKGKPLINFLENLSEGEEIAAVLPIKEFSDTQWIFMATEKGTVKKVLLSAFSNPRKKGIRALEIDEKDFLIKASLVSEKEQVMLFTQGGMAVRFDHEQVRAMGRTARGVRGVLLKSQDDKVIGCEVVLGTEDADESILVVCENGFGKRSSVLDFRQTKRGGVGVKSIVTSSRNGDVIGAVKVHDQDSIVLMSKSGQTVRISASDLRVMGRATQGVKLVQLKEDDALLAIEKLEGIAEKNEEHSDQLS